MAFRGAKRKEIKKSSYYVWFLGAKESRGLRGEEYIHPALRYLIERESEVEPLKVTLQVSSKGLKIIQNVSKSGGGGSNKGGKPTETIKHFIPDSSITCVLQDSPPNDDVVACILLIYNPVSKCPVHVHSYRCDSVETATVLRQHLQVLIDKPENQRKFGELEVRLQSKGLLATPKKANSDGRSVRTESDSSGGGSEKDIYALDERMSSLYDSLAAELREKLNNNKNSGPLLLPPKDYDTVHRMRGKLDHRRGLDVNITGKAGQLRPSGPRAKEMTGRAVYGEHDSSGKSSGIGSDEAPSSPTHERGSKGTDHEGSAPAKKKLNDMSSSDEEWETHCDPQAINEDDMILVQSPRSARKVSGGGKATQRDEIRALKMPPEPSSPPPQTKHRPPSPKLPASYRELYYDNGRVSGANKTGGYSHLSPHQSLEKKPGAVLYTSTSAGLYLADEPDQAPELDRYRREFDHRGNDRPLRRLRSREDHAPSPPPLPTSPVPHMAHPQLSHSRSQDHLGADETRRERYMDDRDRWPPVQRKSKSPPPMLAKQPDFSSQSYREGGYIPLPRVRRLDSGHSSGGGGQYHHLHHNGQPQHRSPSYQELPEDKRYPGLDRETARVAHLYNNTQSKLAIGPGQACRTSKDRDYHWDNGDPQGQKLRRADSNPGTANGGHHIGPAAKHSHHYSTPPRTNSHDRHKSAELLSKGPYKGHGFVHAGDGSVDDSKRFYRYSSSDADYRQIGHRGNGAALTGYQY